MFRLMLLLFFFAGWATTAVASPCSRQEFSSNDYVVCAADPSKLRLFWRNGAGEAYRNFAALADALDQNGQKLIFALNAGMYQPDFSPLGLHIEDGSELRPPQLKNPARAKGPLPNFYKKPNGVFYFDEDKAGIMPTQDFVKKRPKLRFATQSGPMLVIKGRINPIFIEGSEDRTRRSGVGICDNDQIRFIISEDAVNFYDFAAIFRDQYQCSNALFLDGGGGAGFYNADLKRNDFSWHGGYGPMFGLVE